MEECPLLEDAVKLIFKLRDNFPCQVDGYQLWAALRDPHQRRPFKNFFRNSFGTFKRIHLTDDDARSRSSTVTKASTKEALRGLLEEFFKLGEEDLKKLVTEQHVRGVDDNSPLKRFAADGFNNSAFVSVAEVKCRRYPFKVSTVTRHPPVFRCCARKSVSLCLLPSAHTLALLRT